MPAMYLAGPTTGLGFSEKVRDRWKELTSKSGYLVKYNISEKTFHFHYDFMHCPKLYKFQAQGSS